MLAGVLKLDGGGNFGRLFRTNEVLFARTNPADVFLGLHRSYACVLVEFWTDFGSPEKLGMPLMASGRQPATGSGKMAKMQVGTCIFANLAKHGFRF